MVLAAYVSVVVIARLLRGDSWSKLLFNASYATLTVALTDLLARLFFTPMWPWLPEWSAVLAGFVIAHAITSCLTWAFFVLLDHRRPGESARPVVHLYLTGLLNAALGLAAAEMVQSVRWGWLLAVLLALMLAAVYRAYYGLLRDQRDLGVLNDFSLRGGGGRAGVRRGLRRSARTGRGRLEHRDGAGPRAAQRHPSRAAPDAHRGRGCTRSSRAGRCPRPCPTVTFRRCCSVTRRREAGKVLHLIEGGYDPVITEALSARRACEVLVAPLRGADQFLGVIEVHDRQSRVRGFGCADLRLVETMASHLATAMDNRRLLARLRHDAYHDNLTDLRNRLGFREVAGELLRRNSTPGAVIVIDLDVLSSVNDALGHVWGDRVVQAAGERLRAALPSRVLTARLEGGTFAALLVDVEECEALQVAEQVRAALSEPYSVDKLAVECSALVGVALTRIEPTRNVDTLLQRADVALRAARAGDAKVRAYVPSMGQIFLRRFQLVTQFRQALETGQVSVHYQPKVALPSRAGARRGGAGALAAPGVRDARPGRVRRRPSRPPGWSTRSPTSCWTAR